MGELIRSKDWSATPLGAIETWPLSLRTSVSLCLGSNFPVNLIWGPHHIQIYNDGYRLICAGKHPNSLGEAYPNTWFSTWNNLHEAFQTALAGQASLLENQRLFLDRSGYLEETFFNFSLSPIRDESANVAGLFQLVTETTSQILESAPHPRPTRPRLPSHSVEECRQVLPASRPSPPGLPARLPIYPHLSCG